MAQSYHCWLVHGLLPHFRVGFNLITEPWQGGGIAASFAAKYPEMVDEKIILLSPTGLLKVGSNFVASILFIGNLLNRFPTHK
jgi:hypothetical protein